jgi:hypothetical protein
LNFRTLINTVRLFIIAAVFETDGVSLVNRNSSAVDELKTAPRGLNS